MTVLTVAFLSGVVVGRHHPRLLPSLGVAVAKEPRRTTDGRLADRAKPLEPAPVLTFYHELTAPLTSPPPSAKPRSDRLRPVSMEKENAQKSGETRGAARDSSSSTTARSARGVAATTEHAEPAATTLPDEPAGPVTTAPTPAVTRYTIQVGAFKQREQAEAVRARLAAAGHDAFVADLEGPAVTRYRVRVGSYVSRDEARRAAEHLTSTARFATYVTVR